MSRHASSVFCRRQATWGNFGISCKTFLLTEQQVIRTATIWGTQRGLRRATDEILCIARRRMPIDTNEEKGQKLRRYWTNACRTCVLKARCTKGPQRRITRWEHEEVVEAVQKKSIRIRMPCVSGAKRSSIPSVH